MSKLPPAKRAKPAAENVPQDPPVAAATAPAQPSALPAADTCCSYAIVVSVATRAVWPSVVATLVQKYSTRGVTVFACDTWDDAGLARAEDHLRALRPRHTAFIVHWSECTGTFVAAVHCMTRRLDPSHGYNDTLWGIVTGATEADAQAMVAVERPLDIRHVASGSVEGVQLDRFVSGVSNSDCRQADGVGHCVLAL